MSEKNAFLEKYQEYYDKTIEALEAVIKKFKDEYEATHNLDAQKYAEELEIVVSEIKTTVKNITDFNFEQEKVLVDYIEEVLNNYTNTYQTMIAREALKRYASQGEEVVDYVPTWEEAKSENESTEGREIEYYETLPEYSNGDSSKEDLNPNLSQEEERTLTKD